MLYDKKNTKKIILVFAGLLLGVSFSYPDIWFVGFGALIPLLYFLNQKQESFRAAFFDSWMFGFVFLGVVFGWMWDTLPLSWVGIESPLWGASFVFLGWFLMTAVLSFFIGLWGLAARFSFNHTPWALLGIPLLWVIFEYVRMWGFSLLTLGPESLVGPYFSFGFLGYLLSENVFLLSFAGVGGVGVYMLSFFVAAVNVVLYGVFFRYGARSFPVKCAVVVGIFALLVLHTPYKAEISGRTGGTEIHKAALVTTRFPTSVSLTKEHAHERTDAFKDIVHSIGASTHNPDIIIFPEGARFLGSLFRSGELVPFFKNALGGKETLIMDSNRVTSRSSEAKSAIFYYNTKEENLVRSEKVLLAPQGEYIPYYLEFVLRILGREDIVRGLEKNRAYAQGEHVRVGEYGNTKVGGLSCSEIVSPSLYDDITDKGADILVSLASHASFNSSRALYNQVLAMAKVHAVKNDRPFVQVSNFASSFIIDRNGVLLFESLRGGPSVSFVNIPLPVDNS